MLVSISARFVCACELLQAHLSGHQQLALHLFGTHDVVHAGPEDEGSDPASLATAPLLGRSSGVTGSAGTHVVTPHGRVGVTHYRTRVDGLFAVRIRDYRLKMEKETEISNIIHNLQDALRVVKYWNEHPTFVVTVPSASIFKGPLCFAVVFYRRGRPA